MKKAKTLIIVILSLIPLLGVIAFVVWQVMKHKEKTTDEIQNLLLKINGSILYCLLLISFLIASIATGDAIGWILLIGWLIIGAFILLLVSAVNAKKNPQNDIPNVPSMNSNTYIPKCPVCGSPNVQKIHIASKIVDGAMFGLFSKTATSQFECKNCKYKF